jgi:TrmH family RNA methyltransferase
VYRGHMGEDISKTAWRSVKRLLHPRGRQDSGQILVEGARAVLTVLERDVGPDSVLLGSGATPRASEVAHTAQSLGFTVSSISPEQTAEISATAHTQDIFSVVKWKPERSLPASLPGLILHLSGIRNPTNMGALLRTAAALNVTVTCSPDCVDVTNPAALRSGAATYLNLPIFTHVRIDDLRKKAPAHKVVYAAVSDGTLLSQMQWPARTVLVLGGEADGATEAVPADMKVTIASGIESLNVAVAGGILLWNAVSSTKPSTG